MTDKQTIHLEYRPEAMTLNDMCILESPPTWKKIRELLAKHFVDENGNYVEDTAAAEEAVGNIPKDGVFELIRDLRKQIAEYAERDNDPN